jgi:uncharacterized protein (TIGR04551 family)
MSRLLAALAAALALAGSARAQSKDTKPATPAAPAAPGSVEADPKVQAAIQAAVEKAKEELRSEIRAELQGQQSAQEFMGAVNDQPKPQVLDLQGYFRVRGEMLNRLNLKSAPDTAGFNYFPTPLRGVGSSLSSANMRLRLEPTINASESVRVHAQIDVLDNYVLGSNTGALTDSTGSPYPIPYWSSSRVYIQNDPTADRPLIIPKRVWGEVQTPVGLLSFGRMPSQWGLGILANAGTGIDQDYGDSVDRIQFAAPPVSTPLGRLVFVPMYDFDAAGVLHNDQRLGAGSGQPFAADDGDAARALGLKIIRIDNDDEIRRKVEAGSHSLNFGLYYTHRTQRFVYPGWIEGTCTVDSTDPNATPCAAKRRGADGHFGSLWGRWVNARWRIESELVGVYGDIENANSGNADLTALAHVHMRQWGGVIQAEYKYNPKFHFGFEAGAASGDGAPGFGNIPDRGIAGDPTTLPSYGAIEGPQWGQRGDHTINNFRFNPAYQIDQIFYRRILGQITDSVYLRPSARWYAMSGLTIDSAIIYSQAQCASSTPSARSSTPGGPPDLNPGKRPLGVEWDLKATVSPSTAFSGWFDVAAFKPLAGMDATGLAWMIDFGLAAKF